MSLNSCSWNENVGFVNAFVSKQITGSPTDLYQLSIGFSRIALPLYKFTSLSLPPASEKLTDTPYRQQHFRSSRALRFPKKHEGAPTSFSCQVSPRSCPSSSPLQIIGKSEDTESYFLVSVPKHSWDVMSSKHHIWKLHIQLGSHIILETSISAHTGQVLQPQLSWWAFSELIPVYQCLPCTQEAKVSHCIQA